MTLKLTSHLMQKNTRLYFAALFSLNLLACGEGSLQDKLLGTENDVDRLSTDDLDSLAATESKSAHLSELSLSGPALQVMEKVRSYLDSLRKQRDELCGIDSSDRGAFKEQIEAILSDESLDDDQKKELIEQLHEDRRSARETERESIKQCAETNGEQLEALKAKAKPVIEACMGNFHKRHKQKHSKGHKGRGKHKGEKHKLGLHDRPMQMENQAEENLEAKLLSDECSSALENATNQDISEEASNDEINPDDPS